MKRIRDVIGLPVMNVQSGKQIGEIKDIVVDESWHVQSFVLTTGHWFQEATCIRADDALSLGEDALTVDRDDCVQPLAECKGWKLLVGGSHHVKGMPMMTVNGQQLGCVEDVYLDGDMGKQVIGYELTEGFISDLREGRKWLPMPEYVKIGEDALIVPVHASESLEEIFEPNQE
ncbi:PRC-barrel domain-containing protein [Paenibacillus sp. YYML68]|uniref:PRC-barrel domain-containing protein n=1 Tax=Paenibacillus sp. YYML68 TaxID=2909250 RepID=UPI0024916A90|nr:PRC-barrel domain-containing protein [Paenibacillus sp. YYML68]